MGVMRGAARGGRVLEELDLVDVLAARERRGRVVGNSHRT